ncbi:MAG: hypothetical protein OEV30_03725 [Ignavibacteria bacterium]|nr:hypothetical protein [Ignavibacteria bacterium]
MKGDLRVRAGHLLARYRFRKRKDSLISFSETLSAAQSVMVVLPLAENEPAQYQSVTKLLVRRFKGQHITVIATDHAVDVMRLLPRSTIVHFRHDELNRVYLPRPDLQERFDRRRPDITIDLNLDFLLPSAYICKATGASIRIGFSRRFADDYYNFIIRPDRTLARKMNYDRLAEFLQKF